MAQEYLPAPSNVRLADLMKEHNISQPELAKEIGCSKSTISRFISGAKGTLTHEQVLKIARLFNVSTDFLLGETNSLRRKPVYQGDLDDIEMYFMAAVKEIKKGIGSHYAEQEAMSKKVAEKMFTELTKGQDVQHPTITAEQLTDAMLDSVSGMEGATPEALEQLRNGLLGILQSAAEQENAHEADE